MMAFNPMSAKNNEDDSQPDGGVPLYGRATGSAQNQKRPNPMSDAIKRRMTKNAKTNASIVESRKNGE